MDFAYNLFEQSVSVDAVIAQNDMIDTIAITKGRGTEGVVTRWGVTRLPRKTHRGLRKVLHLLTQDLAVHAVLTLCVVGWQCGCPSLRPAGWELGRAGTSCTGLARAHRESRLSCTMAGWGRACLRHSMPPDTAL